MKKSLVLGTAVAAIGLGVMNASALPTGYESVNVQGTLNVQNYSSSKGYYIQKISVSNKDILALIGDEFGTLPSGAKLVSYGLYYGNSNDGLAVLDKNNNVLHSDVNTDAGSYLLNFTFDADDSWIQSGGDTRNYQSSDAQLTFSDYSGDNYFTLSGPAKDNVNWNNYNESYNMSGASGWFYMPMLGVGYNDGLITGGVNGSGQDVYPFDY